MESDEPVETNQAVEDRIDEWRAYLKKHNTIQSVDIEELEDHLRTQISDLCDVGLDEEEAFLVAVKRIGKIEQLSLEFAREHSERLWKQLVHTPEVTDSSTTTKRDAIVAIGLAIAAGIAIKVPEIFGIHFADSDSEFGFYFRNLSLFVLPFLAGYFAWKRNLTIISNLVLAGFVVAAILIMNLYPFSEPGDTLILSMLHLPMALWLIIGIAYAGGKWRSHEQRMNFIRFSGEWFIYYTLIALGGGVLIMFTFFIFNAIGIYLDETIGFWILPCGAAGAVIIGAWLVEAKKSIIENMAPVLTHIFTPLFTLMLLSFLVIMLVTGNVIHFDRELLIGFDLLLVVVLGLLVYAISARDPQKPANFFDVLQLLLILAALIVDALALTAIAARITKYGFSPNKIAALGENIILLVNLGWSAVLYIQFLLKRSPIVRLERWQTAYIPVYMIWMWIVVAVFPLIFSFQ